MKHGVDGKPTGRAVAKGGQAQHVFWPSVVVVNALLLLFLGPAMLRDTIGLYANGLVILGLNVMFVFLYYMTRNRVEVGSLQVKGRTYDYYIGDTLSWYYPQEQMAEKLTTSQERPFGEAGRRFKGLKVMLPAVLPHVYFDTKHDVGRRSPYVIAPSQKVAFEGDFPSNFEVFMPKDAQIEVLSVFQPDVLQTILRHGKGYDIEFYENELHIISLGNVTGVPDRQAELLAVATEILGEIDSRMDIWARNGFESGPLVIYRQPGLGIGGWHVSIIKILAAVFLLVPGLLLVLVTIVLFIEAVGGRLGFGDSFAPFVFAIAFLAGYANIMDKEHKKDRGFKVLRTRKHKPDNVAEKRSEKKLQDEAEAAERQSVKAPQDQETDDSA